MKDMLKHYNMDSAWALPLWILTTLAVLSMVDFIL